MHDAIVVGFSFFSGLHAAKWSSLPRHWTSGAGTGLQSPGRPRCRERPIWAGPQCREEASSLHTQVSSLCLSCDGYLKQDCGAYTSGLGVEVAGPGIATIEQLCPEGSTAEPECLGCAAGFYEVGAQAV